MNRPLYYHSLLFSGCVLLILLFIAFAQLNLASPEWIWIVWVGFVAMGLLHGAFDMVLARPITQPLLGRLWLVIFLVSYVTLAISVIGIWIRVPTLSLTLFLIMSALHFGLSDGDHDKPFGSKPFGLLESLARGSAVIALPAAFHSDAVIMIFSQLAPLATAQALTTAWSLGAVPCIGILIGVSFYDVYAQNALAILRMAERLALISLFLFVPPLLAFAIYFAGLHAPRHILRLLEDAAFYSIWRGFLFSKLVIPVVLATGVTIGIAVWIIWQRHFILPLHEAIIPVIFVGLAALTVPHSILSAIKRLQCVKAVQMV